MSKDETIPKVYGFEVFDPKSDESVIGPVYFDMPRIYHTVYQGPLIQKALTDDDIKSLEKIMDDSRKNLYGDKDEQAPD